MVTCAVCRRSFPEPPDDPDAFQTHHLWPERRAESPTVRLCRPCHDQVHALFANEELRESYDSAAALRDADRMAGYLDWIRSTAKLDIRVETSDHVRRRR